MKRKSAFYEKKPSSLAGVSGILPGSAPFSWDLISQKLMKTARGFGFLRFEPSLLEDHSLYAHANLEHGSVVHFNDPENAKVAFKAVVWPGLFKAYAEKKLNEIQKQSKLYYLTNLLWYDDGQRKFFSPWEYGFEILGEISALNQVQLISAVWSFFKALGLQNLSIEINSVGQTDHRNDYEDSLRNFLQNKKYELCGDCVASLDNDVLRVFRCLHLECKTLATEAPILVDYLDDDCRKEFTDVLEGLDELRIMYSLSPMTVGKPGASRVVFTVKCKDQQGEYFFGEGSGHEDLFEAVTGKKINSFGFSGFTEPLQTLLGTMELPTDPEGKSEVFLVPLGDLAAKKSLRLFSELWDAKIAVHDNFGNIGVKNQLKMAESSKATIALIMGQKEAMDELVILRDVKSGMQEVFQYERIIDEVKKRLGKL